MQSQEPAVGAGTDRPVATGEQRAPGNDQQPARRISPPVVAALLVGLVSGSLLTLLAVGAIQPHPSDSVATPGTLPPATPRPSAVMATAIRRVISRQLGAPFPGPGKTRVIAVSVTPIFSRIVPIPAQVPSDYRNVTIVFRLNDHPLGKLWRLRAARADVFTVMKSVYTSQLPVYDTELRGEFPLPGRKRKDVLQTVLVCGLDHDDAVRLPWKRWGRESEGRLWQLLTYKYVNPRFG